MNEITWLQLTQEEQSIMKSIKASQTLSYAWLNVAYTKAAESLVKLGLLYTPEHVETRTYMLTDAGRALVEAASQPDDVTPGGCEIKYSVGAKVRLLYNLRRDEPDAVGIPPVGAIGTIQRQFPDGDYEVDFPGYRYGNNWALKASDIQAGDESAVTPADYAAVEAAGETVENVFGDDTIDVYPPDGVVFETTVGGKPQAAVWVSENGIHRLFIEAAVVDDKKAEIERLQAENRALQDRVTELLASADEADARARKVQADAAAFVAKWLSSLEDGGLLNLAANFRQSFEETNNAGADLLARLEQAEAARDAFLSAESIAQARIDTLEHQAERVHKSLAVAVDVNPEQFETDELLTAVHKVYWESDDAAKRYLDDCLVERGEG